MIEGLMWIVVAVTLVGTAANVLKRRWCFLLWVPTNACWVGYNAWRGEWPMAVIFTAYFGLAVWGWFRWKKERTTKSTKGTKGRWQKPSISSCSSCPSW